MKMRVFAVCVVIFLSSALNVFSAVQNLVTNGSFETPTAPLSPGWIEINSGSSFLGWTVTGNNAVDIHAGEGGVPWTNVPDGKQALDLNGSDASGIYQDLATVSGTTYKLRFCLSSNPVCNPPTVQVQVSFGGRLVDQPSFNTAGNTLANMRWEIHDYTVLATGSVSRIEFTSKTFGTSCGPAIDAIQVIPYSACADIAIKPHTFTAGTSAKSAEVNADFDTIYQQINTQNCQIQALKAIVCQDHPTASVCQ